MQSVNRNSNNDQYEANKRIKLDESASAVETTSAKVVKLVPPIISRDTIQEEIVCVRPTRSEGFDFSIQKRGQGLVVNCCGHGGSGWTTLFGSVDKVITQFVLTYPFFPPTTPIRIVGSGCMGLTMAIELKRRGFDDIRISTKEKLNIPSWKAAGCFSLGSVLTSQEEDKKVLSEIGTHTFKTYQQIDKGEHPYISKDAVRWMPLYCSQETESGVEDLEAKGLIPKRERVTLDFGDVQHENYFKFMTYFMNTTTMMRQLTAKVEALKIPITMEKIESFDEVTESIVFNCSGMGTRELKNDATMVPTCGHLQILNDKAGAGHLDYMIYSKVSNDEYVYLFPKNVSVTVEHPNGTSCNGVLGGTFIPHIDKLSTEEQYSLHKREFKKLEDRNKLFFYGH